MKFSTFLPFLSLAILLAACAPQAAANTPTPDIAYEPVVISGTQEVTPSPIPVIVTPTLEIPTITPATTLIPTLNPNGLTWYEILPGDTLEGIASKYRLTIEDLVTVNHITDPNLIFAGQRLLISSIDNLPTLEPTVSDGKQIVVVLSTQRTYAYDDGELAHDPFVVSTGISDYPTVTGEYKIERKYELQDMTGGSKEDGSYYYLANVPWIMYFHLGYAFHGTYWHNNFGVPMSHGCVNMKTNDAEWLYNWASADTPVLVLP